MFLQVLIILSGNYNFFNLLTMVLCLSLLDDQHVNFWLRRTDKSKEKSDGMRQTPVILTASVSEITVKQIVTEL